ncbi:MAG: COX15/CtaA family protein [Alicyclobacillus sp.]|nr:COX15/CtaA family protein [Alicyclobacillus sp.]
MRYRLPLWTTGAVGVQMVLGGLIVGKDAGFVCPDWPLCRGDVIPRMNGLVALEMVHRGSALVVLVLVLWTAWWVRRSFRHQRSLWRTAVAALASLCLQVLVGGLIVLFKLPGVVTTVDVLNSMVMLTLMVRLTVRAERAARDSGPSWSGGVAGHSALRRPALRVLWAAYLAVGVGAIFRHTGASQALFGQMSYLASHGQHTPPSPALSGTLLVLHVGTGGLLAAAAGAFLRAARREGVLVRAATAQACLVGLQAALGMTALATQLEWVVATLHWATAGLLMAVTSWLACEAAPARAEARERALVAVPEPGTVR